MPKGALNGVDPIAEDDAENKAEQTYDEIERDLLTKSRRMKKKK